MNTQSMPRTVPGLPARLLAMLGFALLWAGPLPAQVPVDQDGNPIEALDDTVGDEASAGDFESDGLTDEEPPLTAEELQELVGPVALYPDKLLAIVLPASTYPLEIVQAARFLERLEDDSSLKPDESWDDSVTALLNYPEVVRMMDEDIDWTWRLGEAVVRQQPDVIAAVESFRDRAYAAGNLKTDERQRVSNTDGTIEIQPLQEDIIYVPYYEPERVVYYQPRQVYYYHPRPYPVYYYPYPAHHSFLSGYFWGVTTAFNIGWATDHLHVFHHSYWGHPYYGRQYFGHYYRRPSIVVYNTYYGNNYRNRTQNHHRDGDYWRPRDGGPRPGHYNARLERFRDHPRERTVEGYRVPDRDGRSTAGVDRRAGFVGEAATRNNRNSARDSDDATTRREGFAASRNRAEDRVRTEAATRARQADTSVSRDAPVRFRSRDGAAVPSQSGGRNTGIVTRVPERTGTARPEARRDDGDPIRFRPRANTPRGDTPRANTDSGTSARQGTQAIRPSVSTGSARARATNRSPATARAPAVRSQPAPSPRTVAPSTANRGFQASPGPAARPNVSRPQASPRTAPARASTPRAAPRPSASSAPPRAQSAPQSATRAAPARQDRGGASSRGADRTPKARTSRER